MTTIPSWAVKGAKVVCVDDAGFLDLWQGNFPTKGGIYTVSKSSLIHSDSIFLDECPPDRNGIPCSWSVWRFRPVIKRTQEQDIAEHFSHHLRQPVRETERAE